jgi:dTDP-L-rhamnose 4-epimerase
LPVTTLRYFNVYGSGQSLKNPYTGVVSIFFSLLREGKALSMYESGLPIRDFVHVRDVVQANLLALSSPQAAGQKFNVGSGVPATIADIARTQAQAMKLEASLEDRGEFRVGDIFACYADLEHSRRDLGFKPQVDLLQGMEEFVAWASGQASANLYDKTVSELRAHGLFGQARRS